MLMHASKSLPCFNPVNVHELPWLTDTYFRCCTIQTCLVRESDLPNLCEEHQDGWSWWDGAQEKDEGATDGGAAPRNASPSGKILILCLKKMQAIQSRIGKQSLQFY